MIFIIKAVRKNTKRLNIIVFTKVGNPVNRVVSIVNKFSIRKNTLTKNHGSPLLKA